MKQIRLLAQYYVDLMMKLGLVRFSMLLALALVVLALSLIHISEPTRPY